MELGSPSARKLASFVGFYDLALCNSVLNCNDRILGLVFSNVDIRVEQSDCSLVPEDAHYPSLVVTVQVWSTDNSQLNCIELFDFRRADYLLLYYQLRAYRWGLMDNLSKVDEAVDLFYTFIYECFDNCIPKRMVRPGGTKYQPWFNAEIIRLLKRMDRCAMKQHFSLYHNEQFKRLRSQVKQFIAHEYHNYLDRVETNIKSDAKSFWGFVNARRANSSTQEGMHWGDQIFGLHDLPNGFAQYFSSVFSDESQLDVDNEVNLDSRLNVPSLSISFVDLRAIIAAIGDLRLCTGCGPDNVPSCKGCAEILGLSAKIIFDLSLRSSVFPSRWKIGRVTPIFKSGRRNDISNLRPIWD